MCARCDIVRMHLRLRRCVGNDPLWRIEIVSKSKAHRAHAICTHIHILQSTLQTRVLVCDCDGAKFGVHSGTFHEDNKTNDCKKRSAEESPVNGSTDFVPARSHQLVRLPLFLSGRELLFAKSFPPVQGIAHFWCGRRPASGANIHWQTSTVLKYTQWDRAVEFRSPLKRGAARENYLIDCTLWY